MTKYEKCLYTLNNFRIICDARRKTITILWRYIHMAQIDRFYCEIVSKTIIPSNVCHRKTFTAFCHRKGFMGNYNVFFFRGSFSVRLDTKLFQTIYKRTFTVCFSVDQSIHKRHFTIFILFYFLLIYFSYIFIVSFGFVSERTQIRGIWLARAYIILRVSIGPIFCRSWSYSDYIWFSTPEIKEEKKFFFTCRSITIAGR